MAGASGSGEVDMFVAVTNCSRIVANSFLIRYHDVEKAIDAYYQNGGNLPPEQTWEAWDETQFHGEREHGPENRPNSFQVHSTDNTASLGPNLFNHTLSRPPSRVSNKSEDDGIAEDRDLQQAISMSLSQTLPGQETGVTDGANFKPATKSYYDPTQWSMTTTRQFLPNPDPEFRKRMEGAPAFMKPSMRDDYLPALITVLHQIPLAREALLARDSVLQDYGWGDDWWDGEPIPLKQVTITDDNNRTSQLDADNVVIETQRLMAFLELSSRAYGNVSVLGQVAESGDDGDEGAIDKFLMAWVVQITDLLPDYPLRHIFDTHAISDASRPTDEEGNNVTVRVIKLFGSAEDLYQALDDALWNTWTPESSTMPYLSFGEILVFQQDKKTDLARGQATGFDAPISWYADRYLKENVPQAKKALETRHDFLTELKEIIKLQNKLRFIPTSDPNRSIDAQDLLGVIKPFFAGELPKDCESDERDSTILSGRDYHPLEKYKKMSEELQQIADQIMIKHQALEEAKEKVEMSIKQATSFLKAPSSTIEEGPTHRYTLRGVAIDSRTTYVLANPNAVEDLVDLELEDWQWWKISFDPSDLPPISWEKVEEHQVLEATKKDAKDLMLIYATDKAVAHPRQKLPESLRNFVRGDNLLFEQELENAQNRSPPSQRKVSEWTGDAWVTLPIAPGRVPESPTDSVLAQADDEFDGSYTDEPLVLSREPTQPPAYSLRPGSPPPVPPRSPNKHRTAFSPPISPPSSPPPIESSQAQAGELVVIDMTSDEGDQVESSDMVEEIENVQDMDSHSTTLGVVPGGPTSGVSDAANGKYADSIRMSDIEETSNEQEVQSKDSKDEKVSGDKFETVPLG